MRKLFLVLTLLSVTFTKAQEYFPVNTGVKTSKNTMVAFKKCYHLYEFRKGSQKRYIID